MFNKQQILVESMTRGDLPKELKLNKKLLTSILNSSKKPTVLAFVTPHLKMFDIYRMVKLSELSRAGFNIQIVLFGSLNQEINKKFLILLDNLIPKNKRLLYLSDISQKIVADPLYAEIVNSIKIKDIPAFLKKNKLLEELSLLNIEHFVMQYYICKSKKYLKSNVDFLLITTYFWKFLNIVPSFSIRDFPSMILLPNILVDWELNDDAGRIRHLLAEGKVSDKEIDFIMEGILMPIKKQLCLSEPFDIIEGLEKLKKLSSERLNDTEKIIGKSELNIVIYALNNSLRRSILSIILNNPYLKAEEIRTKINQKTPRIYTLPNLIKHLNLLTRAKLIQKEKRKYFIRNERFLLDIPLSWFDNE
jgi:hypothetical protein